MVVGVGAGLMEGFYFAVQSGGTFEINYSVMDPDDKLLLEGAEEKQGDYIFTANKVSLPPSSASSRARMVECFKARC